MKFSELSRRFEELENTSSRLTMTGMLADLFKKASGSEVGPLCYLLQGRVAPRYEAVEFGMADKFVIRAIVLAFDADPSHVIRIFKQRGDLGRTAQDVCLSRNLPVPDIHPSITQVFTQLTEIAHAAGTGSQERKIRKLAEVMRMMDPLSVRYLARIPLDKLRLGFSDMTILDGLSVMLTGDKSQRPHLEAAFNVRPDIGYIAKTVKEYGIQGLSHVKAAVGAPILAALCQRLGNADEMIKKMRKVAVEPKYDGVRVQIHAQQIGKPGFRVHSYSRNLENTTDMFPELMQLGNQLHADSVILDSEAVGLDPATGKLIPFQETVTRKRKHGIDVQQSSVPLRFFVFDIMYKDGKQLLDTPLNTRRKILEQTVGKGQILSVSPQIITDDPDMLRSYHNDQIAKGLEGVVVKQYESPYEPGRRGYLWVKYKEEGRIGKLTDTIDAVVMGYYYGEGKRAGFGIGAFLVGVRRNDQIVSMTKIGTGVSDELWRQLFTKLDELKSSKRPARYGEVPKILEPDVWIEPRVVVEVAGDDLTKSPTHGAGIAVRFPRLVRIRDDKGPDDATSLAELEDLYKNQSNQN
jgi:DNA ligase 1